MAAATTSGPSISLDLGSTGKAWDDRELVNAYDAALIEFHIHNPGPGSWLDKATAALAKGQPLPGATAFGTTWYSAAKDEPKDAAPAKKKRKANPNPYTSANKGKEKATEPDRAESPTYQPASPAREQSQWDEVVWPPNEGEDEGEEAEGEGEGNEEEEGWQGYDGLGAEQPSDAEQRGTVFPPPSGEWPGGTGIGRDEAIGYALHAQYWAGYWMGIAHGAGSSGAVGPPRANRGTGTPNGLKR